MNLLPENKSCGDCVHFAVCADARSVRRDEVQCWHDVSKFEPVHSPKTEKEAVNSILLGATRRGARLFINRVAKAWVGVVAGRSGNSITLSAYRPIEAGLGSGSSDLIGWTPVLITPDMVGRTVAVFTAVEVKSEKGRISEAQKLFLGVVEKSGGIAALAKSDVDMLVAVTKFQSEIR